MKHVFAALMLGLAACSPPAPSDPIPVEGEPQAVAQAPAEVIAAVNAALPGFVATSAISDNSTGAQGYRVEGASGGVTYNVQLMHANEGWNVVSIRHDIAWADAPQVVRTAAGSAPEPARVVENREPGADGVIYELYAAGSDTPATEIRMVGNEAAVMPPPH